MNWLWCGKCGTPKLAEGVPCMRCEADAYLGEVADVDAPRPPVPDEEGQIADVDTPPPGVIDWIAERAKRGKPLPPAPVADHVVEDAALVLADDTRRHIACDHKRVFVDEVKREITCQECKALVDPIWVLARYAHRERDFAWNQKHLVREKAELDEHVANAKKVLALAKKGLRKDPMAKEITALKKHVSDLHMLGEKYKAMYQLACEQLKEHGIIPRKVPKRILGLSPE